VQPSARRARAEGAFFAGQIMTDPNSEPGSHMCASFRQGPTVTIRFTGYARPGAHTISLFGPAPEETMRVICDRLGAAPDAITCRAARDEVEVRAIDSAIGPGVIFAVIWDGITASDANTALRDLQRVGWFPKS